MVSVVFLLNALSLFLLAGIAFSTYIHWHGKKGGELHKVAVIIGLCGLLFSVVGVLYTTWFLQLLSPTLADFIIIQPLISVLRTALIFFLVYAITGNKSLFYFFLVYLAVALVAGTTLLQFFLFIAGLSFLLLLLMFLEIIYMPNYYLKRAGYLGIAYAYLSLLFLVLVYLGYNPSKMYWFIPNLFLLASFAYLFLDIKAYGLPVIKKPYMHRKYTPIFFVFFKFMTYMITVPSFFLISTIAIHEFGHAITAEALGCPASKAVIYEIASSPHTELSCPDMRFDVIITLAGLGLTLALGGIFLFTEGSYTTMISYLIFGYAVLTSYRDLKDLSVSDNMLLILMLGALMLIIYGTILLALHYINQTLLPGHTLSSPYGYKDPVNQKTAPKQENI